MFLRYHNIEQGKSYDGKIQDLFKKEKDITDNNEWTPLMHLCDKDIRYSYNCEKIAHFLQIFPELLE